MVHPLQKLAADPTRERKPRQRPAQASSGPRCDIGTETSSRGPLQNTVVGMISIKIRKSVIRSLKEEA